MIRRGEIIPGFEKGPIANQRVIADYMVSGNCHEGPSQRSV